MTREEAITNLEMIRVAFVEPITEEQRKLIDDTFDMAIEALKQEPSGDLVNRQAVLDGIEELKRSPWCTDKRNGYEYLIAEALDVVKDLCIKQEPSVNPQEPKTGHWIADVDKWGDVVTTINGYKCSECGEFNADKDNYCPNCGCLMDRTEFDEYVKKEGNL